MPSPQAPPRVPTGKIRATPAKRRVLPRRGAPAGTDAADRVLTRTERAVHRMLHPWYSRKRYLVPILLVVLVVLASLSWTLGRPPEPAPPPVAVVRGGVGTLVQDGWFRFTVRDVQDLGKTVGAGTAATATAEGTYVVVYVDVTNLDGVPRALGAANQRLLDPGGHALTATMEGGLPGTDAAFLRSVQPGQTSARVPLLFDVPHGFRRAAVELVGSPFSPGVRVSL